MSDLPEDVVPFTIELHGTLSVLRGEDGSREIEQMARETEQLFNLILLQKHPQVSLILSEGKRR